MLLQVFIILETWMEIIMGKLLMDASF